MVGERVQRYEHYPELVEGGLIAETTARWGVEPSRTHETPPSTTPNKRA